MSEQEAEFGDFKEIKQESEDQGNQQEAQPLGRVRMPKKGELIGIIIQRLGGNRMDIKATDGKTRNCRVPGKYRRRLWLRPKDIVLIVPWELDDNKADIIYKYQPIAVKHLRKNGIIDSLTTDF